MLQDNLKKTAVALEYEKGDMAPKVIASGRGYIADRIIKTAEESAVPVDMEKIQSKLGR